MYVSGAFLTGRYAELDEVGPGARQNGAIFRPAGWLWRKKKAHNSLLYRPVLPHRPVIRS